MRCVLLSSLIFLSPASHTQPISERADKGDLVFMQDEEPAMRIAFAKAAESLDDFLVKAKEASPDHTAFAMKVAVSQGKNTEYFWVNSFSERSPGVFEGEIGNEPRMVTNVKYGQRYVFQRSRIVDWTYIEKANRKMVGNFTLCALLTKETKVEADAMKRRFKLDCGWLP
jgi:uncharacterized protein YegJ (DUF2314 family)